MANFMQCLHCMDMTGLDACALLLDIKFICHLLWKQIFE